jgi:hypothetical protein
VLRLNGSVLRVALHDEHWRTCAVDPGAGKGSSYVIFAKSIIGNGK